ncbi:MAG: arylsulfatase [Pirellulales bacterium]|nr:arylsulfatase [Pirellulales bacterium]
MDRNSQVEAAPAHLLGQLLHRITTFILTAVTAGVSIGAANYGKSAESTSVPNIVLILADDLGYAELGCYGQQKIKTPNLDRMAAEGIRFTQHYCGNAVCAPSRCVLMTGKHPGHAYIRNNAQAKLPEELKRRYDFDFPGQEPIPDAEVTLAEMLKAKGYATGAAGKWGLGQFGTAGDPNRQGFDLFFGYNCQAHAHSFYPAHLWRNGAKVKLDNDPPIPGHAQLPPGADPKDPSSYAPYKGKDYSADRIIDAALGFIRENKDRPFFLYFPTTIPHLALHVPDEELKPYLGKWEETPFTGPGGYTPHQTPRAAYAAMISRLDQDVARILAVLQELGLDENTLVMFSSDNGTTHLEKEVDFEFFESVGPLRGLKGSLYEGGIRVPMIARWPGKIKPGTVTDHISAFWDVMPTIAELTGAVPPDGIDGVSFAPTLLGRPDEQKQREYLYWEFPAYGGQQALRMGDWKAVRQNMFRRNNPDPLKIELYNLKDDIGESRDLAAHRPEIVDQLRKLLDHARTPSRIFPFPPLDNDPAAAKSNIGNPKSKIENPK